MINLPYVINLWFLLPKLRYILQNPDDPTPFICLRFLLPKLYYIFILQSVTIDFPYLLIYGCSCCYQSFIIFCKVGRAISLYILIYGFCYQSVILFCKVWREISLYFLVWMVSGFLLLKLYYILQSVTKNFPVFINLWFLLLRIC